MTAEEYLEREGYRRCDIPACNCGSWHRHSEGNQPPSDVRGDPVAPRTANDDSAPNLPDPSAVLRPPIVDLTFLLTGIEWMGPQLTGYRSCPSCLAYKQHGHLESCQLAAFLAAVLRPPPERPTPTIAQGVFDPHCNAVSFENAQYAPSSGIAVPQTEKVTFAISPINKGEEDDGPLESTDLFLNGRGIALLVNATVEGNVTFSCLVDDADRGSGYLRKAGPGAVAVPQERAQRENDQKENQDWETRVDDSQYPTKPLATAASIELGSIVLTPRCPVCERHTHAKWHNLAKNELNPVALIQFAESVLASESAAKIVGYITRVTGIDVAAMRAMLESEQGGLREDPVALRTGDVPHAPESSAFSTLAEPSPLQLILEWRGKALNGGPVGSTFYECAAAMEDVLQRDYDAPAAPLAPSRDLRAWAEQIVKRAGKRRTLTLSTFDIAELLAALDPGDPR